VVGEQNRRVGLARHLDDPALVSPAQARGLTAPRQLGQQRLGPEVLMKVDLQFL
jgi:hypothetical protein